ncbi:MAG: hypothetical protein ACLGI5_06955 [Thermoleophilia bacterium]
MREILTRAAAALPGALRAALAPPVRGHVARAADCRARRRLALALRCDAFTRKLSQGGRVGARLARHDCTVTANACGAFRSLGL